jgi:hypothetical protein
VEPGLNVKIVARLPTAVIQATMTNASESPIMVSILVNPPLLSDGCGETSP